MSPIVGAFYLLDLDEQLDRTGLFWRRYQDDIIVLAPTRWKLRRAVRLVHQVFDALGLRMHPDKTYIGCMAKGFDFLGYAIHPGGLSVARQTLERFVARVRQFYERERGASSLGDYTDE